MVFLLVAVALSRDSLSVVLRQLRRVEDLQKRHTAESILRILNLDQLSAANIWDACKLVPEATESFIVSVFEAMWRLATNRGDTISTIKRVISSSSRPRLEVCWFFSRLLAVGLPFEVIGISRKIFTNNVDLSSSLSQLIQLQVARAQLHVGDLCASFKISEKIVNNPITTFDSEMSSQLRAYIRELKLALCKVLRPTDPEFTHQFDAFIDWTMRIISTVTRNIFQIDAFILQDLAFLTAFSSHHVELPTAFSNVFPFSDDKLHLFSLRALQRRLFHASLTLHLGCPEDALEIINPMSVLTEFKTQAIEMNDRLDLYLGLDPEWYPFAIELLNMSCDAVHQLHGVDALKAHWKALIQEYEDPALMICHHTKYRAQCLCRTCFTTTMHVRIAEWALDTREYEFGVYHCLDALSQCIAHPNTFIHTSEDPVIYCALCLYRLYNALEDYISMIVVQEAIPCYQFDLLGLQPHLRLGLSSRALHQSEISSRHGKSFHSFKSTDFRDLHSGSGYKEARNLRPLPGQ